jgi:hypothetical protein
MHFRFVPIILLHNLGCLHGSLICGAASVRQLSRIMQIDSRKSNLLLVQGSMDRLAKAAQSHFKSGPIPESQARFLQQ